MSDQQLQEKLCLIFGWSNERVVSTSYLQMLGKLVGIVEDYEKIIQKQKETIEDHRETLARVDAYLIVLRGLANENQI